MKEYAIKSALEKVKAQKENFGFIDRFDVDENYVVAEALEKQVPKKPLNITKYENGVAKRYENCSVVKCANCNGRLKMKSRGKYCDKCGQKIDWNE